MGDKGAVADGRHRGTNPAPRLAYWSSKRTMAATLGTPSCSCCSFRLNQKEGHRLIDA